MKDSPQTAMTLPSTALLFAGVTVALLLPQAYFWKHTCDDAYITFRYIAQAAAGHGLVFNPGERIEGYSHPLFALLLLAANVLGGNIILSAKLIGIFSTITTAALLLDILRRETQSVWSVLCGIGIWLAAPGVHLYASAGLETPLLGALLAAALWCESTRRHALWAGLALGLAALTRPEAILAGPLWLVWRSLSGRREGLFIGAMAWLIFPILWQIFRLMYYGAWLPNPFHAKPPGTFGGYFGIPYIGPFLVASAPPLVLAALLSSERKPSLGILAVLIALPGLILSIYSRGDWMPFGRFLIPAWGMMALLVAMGVDGFRLRGVRAALVAIAAIGSAGLALTTRVPSYIRGDDLDEIMRGSRQVAAGEWLAERVKPNETVATIRLGGLAYAMPNHRVLDMAGLTNREAAKHLGSHAGTLTWETHPMRNPPPDWIAVVATQGSDDPPHGDDALDRDLKEFYVLEGTLPQGPVQEWRFFRRLP